MDAKMSIVFSITAITTTLVLSAILISKMRLDSRGDLEIVIHGVTGTTPLSNVTAVIEIEDATIIMNDLPYNNKTAIASRINLNDVHYHKLIMIEFVSSKVTLGRVMFTIEALARRGLISIENSYRISACCEATLTVFWRRKKVY